jgi:hypothetical protein
VVPPATGAPVADDPARGAARVPAETIPPLPAIPPGAADEPAPPVFGASAPAAAAAQPVAPGALPSAQLQPLVWPGMQTDWIEPARLSASPEHAVSTGKHSE